LPTDTVTRNLEDEGPVGDLTTTGRDIDEDAKDQTINHKSPKIDPKNISQVPDSRAHQSHRSQSIRDEIDEPTHYSCYHKGCYFYTDDEGDYRRHVAQKHPKNPLLYPSKAEIDKFGLKAQGKHWEI
jgi:hypothetical protein